jgi:hypothetical protein
MAFDIGDSVPLAWNVKDANGTLINAAGTVTLTVTHPDGTSETPTVPVPGTTGQYQVTYVPATAGRYTWNAVTTQPNTSYGDVFQVRQVLSPALLSLAEAKSHLNIPATTTTFDDELREFMEAVTSVVEDFVGPIVRRTYTRRAMGYKYTIRLPHTQVRSITSVVSVRDGSTVDTSLLVVDSLTGILRYKDLLGRFPFGELDVTYIVGRDYVEPTWTLAAKEIMASNWRGQLGNLPAVQGADDRIIPTNQGVPFYMSGTALTLLSKDNTSTGFA